MASCRSNATTSNKKKKNKFLKVDPRDFNILINASRSHSSSSKAPGEPSYGPFPDLEGNFQGSGLIHTNFRSTLSNPSSIYKNQKQTIDDYINNNPYEGPPLSWPALGRGSIRGRQILKPPISLYETEHSMITPPSSPHGRGSSRGRHILSFEQLDDDEQENKELTTFQHIDEPYKFNPVDVWISGVTLEDLSIKPTPVYPQVTFNLLLDELTSMELSADLYADYKTHKFIFRDSPTFTCFRHVILKNSHLFKDKVILDVGCGLGLLSLFAAEAGAKHVISVDCSVITQVTKQIVNDNGYSDVITVIHSRMEDVKSLPHGIDKVDLILSSWMGQCLYLDSVFNAVIYARDKFLKKGGIILPDKARLYAIGANDRVAQQKHSFWYNVYDFDFECVQQRWNTSGFHHYVTAGEVLTKPTLLHSIDLNTCSLADCNFKQEFTLSSCKTGFLNSVLLYFQVDFLDSFRTLDTSPHSAPTHWGQTSLYFGEVLLGVNDNTKVLCYIEFFRKNDLNNTIHCHLMAQSKTYNHDIFEKTFQLEY